MNFSDSNCDLDITQTIDLHPRAMYDTYPFHPDQLKDETFQIRIPLNGTFSYSYYVHGSVGNWWDSQYDHSVFEMTPSIRCLDPKRNETMCGADEAVKTETFKALEKGNFTIEINLDYRGKTTRLAKIKVEVC